MTSPDQGEQREPLAAKIAAAMLEAQAVTKSGENREQGYRFASAEAILAAVREPLLRRGVILTAPAVPDAYVVERITSSRGTEGDKITVALDFTFTDGHEELVIGGWRGVGQDYGDKAVGKAYTNAVKTFIRTNWLLPTEHDDPEASSPGDRRATGAAPLPAWAQSTDRPAEWGEALIPLVGRDRAASAWQAVKGSLGDVPDLAVMVAKLLAGQVAQVQARAGVDEDVATHLVAEGEPDPAGDPSTSGQPDTPTSGEPDTPGNVPAPGSLPAPDPDTLSTDPAKATAELKAAGCTCPAPIVAQRAATELGPAPDERDVDLACPLAGHGIPF